MRAVRAVSDALLVGGGYVVAGIVGLVLSLSDKPEGEHPLVFFVGGVVAFGGLAAWGAREIKRAPLAPDGTVVESFPRAARGFALIWLAIVSATALVDDVEFGAVWLGVGVGVVGQALWFARFERRTRYLLLRRLWTFGGSRFLLQPLKDTPPAQRISAHAQSEAARRAP